MVFAASLLTPFRAYGNFKEVWIPQPNTPTYTVLAFYAIGCTPVPGITGVIEVQPKHGSVVVVGGTYTTPACPGVEFPGVQANYTWSDPTGQPGSGTDSFNVEFFAPPGYNGQVDYDIVTFEGFNQKLVGCSCDADQNGGNSPVAGLAFGGGGAGDAGGAQGRQQVTTSGSRGGGGPYLIGTPPGNGTLPLTGTLPLSGATNAGNGNMFEAVTDYSSSGMHPLAFARYYNNGASVTSFAHSLGQNWRSNYDRYLDILSPTVVAAERPTGQVLGFFWNGNSWISDSDTDVRLIQSGNTWTLTDHNDTVETYTTTATGDEALLNMIALRGGYTQTLAYNGNRQVTSVTDTYNRTLSFSYANGLLQSVSTPDELTFTYGYAAVGSGHALTSVSYSTSPATSIQYVYEDSHLPFALTGIVDENGHRYATWSYDDTTGRTLTSQYYGGADFTRFGYNDSDGSSTITNALGVTDTYTYMTLQNAPKVVQINRAATATTAAAVRMFTYDGNGYLQSATDWNGNITNYRNDAHGQPTAIVEAAGTPQQRETDIAYHSTYHLPVTVRTADMQTSFTYDSDGNLLTVTDSDGHDPNRTWTLTWANSLLASIKTSRTDVDGTTQFNYDSTGALISIANALGQQTKITNHTGGGLPLTVVDPNNVTTTLQYDGRLHLHTSTLHTAPGRNLATSRNYDRAGNLQEVVLPDGATLSYGYDRAHRLVSVTDSISERISYTLDKLGDVTQINVQDSSQNTTWTRSASFDALGRLLQDVGGVGQTTSYTYDGNGNALTIKSPLNRTTTRTFDALNRVSTSTDATGGLTTIGYDVHDRIVSVTDPNGAQTTYTRNGYGEVVRLQSPDSGTSQYSYDADGDLITKQAATGNVTQYTYDALDRLANATYPQDNQENVTYTYDQSGHGFGIGQLTSATDAAGTLSRSYDERGNVIQELRGIASHRLGTVYRYDAAGRLASIVYPSRWTVSYARNAMGQVDSISANGLRGPRHQVLSGVSYEPFGPVQALTYGNHIAESRSFDLAYRLKTLADRGTTALQQFGYSYDVDDNLKTISDSVHPSDHQTFGYDALDRLQSATGPYGNYSWTYNAVGSRLSETLGGVTTNYTYGSENNRLLTLTANGVTTQTLDYTADGNTSSFNPGWMNPNGDLITALTYNQAGQLASEMVGSQSLSQYTYDAFGQRLIKNVTGAAGSYYQHDVAGKLLEETDTNGRAQVDYVYLGSTPVAVIEPASAAVYFLHNDRLDTPQLATDSGQNIAWSASYLPFGSTSSVQGSITQNLRLPGQLYDFESGWDHNGFRDYVQAWGRYGQTDLIGLGGGVNTYHYANANPWKFTDVAGLEGGDVSSAGGCFYFGCIGVSVTYPADPSRRNWYFVTGFTLSPSLFGPYSSNAYSNDPDNYVEGTSMEASLTGVDLFGVSPWSGAWAVGGQVGTPGVTCSYATPIFRDFDYYDRALDQWGNKVFFSAMGLDYSEPKRYLPSPTPQDEANRWYDKYMRRPQ